MSNIKIKLSIFLNYFLFAILLNSVGTVILQVQHYFGVSESSAAILEGCKDISIALTSLLVGSLISRIGYRVSMLTALAIVALACFTLPLVKTFIAVKILFAVTGISFGLTKVSVYGTIGLITKDEAGHVSMMSFVESFFMVGILTGYFIFGHYIDDKNAHSAEWFKVYYVLGLLSTIAFFLLLSSSLDETAAQANTSTSIKDDLATMLKLLILPLIISFVVCAFLYVLLEQSIMSWLPTFNNKVLALPRSFSIKMASILAGSFALGRFVAGVTLKKFSWLPVLIICLVCTALLIIVTMPLAKQSMGKPITEWADIPIAAYMFPLIGFFLAPIYPAINSVILSALPKRNHGAMSGLIVVFSALGGTLGSIITGSVFQHYGGQTAFYSALVPMPILIIALSIFRKKKNTFIAA